VSQALNMAVPVDAEDASVWSGTGLDFQDCSSILVDDTRHGLCH
jgi:hypothetical protein